MASLNTSQYRIVQNSKVDGRLLSKATLIIHAWQLPVSDEETYLVCDRFVYISIQSQSFQIGLSPRGYLCGSCSKHHALQEKLRLKAVLTPNQVHHGSLESCCESGLCPNYEWLDPERAVSVFFWPYRPLRQILWVHIYWALRTVPVPSQALNKWTLLSLLFFCGLLYNQARNLPSALDKSDRNLYTQAWEEHRETETMLVSEVHPKTKDNVF